MGEQGTNWFRRLIQKLFPKKSPPPVLGVEAGGFSFIWQDSKKTVLWSEAKEVFAFKRDLGIVDRICVGFRISDDGIYWEIDEQLSGYDDVLQAMEMAFPGIVTEWWCKVAFPPFKTNFMMLWGEPRMAAIWQLGPEHLQSEG